MSKNVNRKTWEEFKETGLLWWINTILHMFGWVIIYKYDDDGNLVTVYPARTKYRGFSETTVQEGYKRVTRYLKQNINDLAEEVEN